MPCTVGTSGDAKTAAGRGLNNVLNFVGMLAQQSTVIEAEPTSWVYTWIFVFLGVVALVAFSYGTRGGVIARATPKKRFGNRCFRCCW